MSNTKATKPIVFLSSQDGNSFTILGACSKAARREGWSADQVKSFTNEATAGDYNHLLQTACKYFEVK